MHVATSHQRCLCVLVLLQLQDKKAEVQKAIDRNKGVVGNESEAHSFMAQCLTSLYRHFEANANARYDFSNNVDKQPDMRMPPRLEEMAAAHIEQASRVLFVLLAHLA